jgi:hypothetical protein
MNQLPHMDIGNPPFRTLEANGGAVSGALGIQHAVGVISAADTPVGEAAFEATKAQECASKACHLMDTLDAFQLPAQDRWLLLQGSLQLLVAHLPRVGEWAAVGTAVMVAEDRALQSTGAILGRETGAHCVHAQLTLPRRHGGFAIPTTLKGEQHTSLPPPQPSMSWQLSPTPFGRLKALRACLA